MIIKMQDGDRDPLPAGVALPAAFHEELARLPPPGPAPEAEATLLEHGAAFVKGLMRVGKQQMKTAQEVSLLQAEVHELLGELRRAVADKEEVISMLRRERDGLQQQNEVLLRELLGLTDLFEHALRFAQRSGDRRWIEELERLDKSMLQVLARLGLREVAALGLPFDPMLHEVLETVPRARLKKTSFPEARVHDIVEVAQRGFHMGGVVVRRARVITAAE